MFDFGKKNKIRNAADALSLVIIAYKDKINDAVVEHMVKDQVESLFETFGKNLKKDFLGNVEKDNFFNEVKDIVSTRTAVVSTGNMLPYRFSSPGISKKNPCWVVNDGFSVSEDLVEKVHSLKSLKNDYENYKNSLSNKNHADRELVNLFKKNISELNEEVKQFTNLFVEDLRAYYKEEMKQESLANKNNDNEKTLDSFHELVSMTA